MPSRGCNNCWVESDHLEKAGSWKRQRELLKVFVKSNQAVLKMQKAGPCPRLANSESYRGPGILRFLKKILFIYFYTEVKRGRKRGRETPMCNRYIHQLPLARPQLGTWPATQACAWLGIEPVTFQSTSRHSIHWATPARASFYKHSPSDSDVMVFHLCAEKHWFQRRGKATEPAKPTGTLGALSQVEKEGKY